MILDFTDKLPGFDAVAVHDKAKLLKELSVFWWRYMENICPHPLKDYSAAESVEIEDDLDGIQYEFLVIGHLHGKLYDMYKIAGDAFLGYKFSGPIARNGVLPTGKDNRMCPIMIGLKDGQMLTVKEMIKTIKTKKLTEIAVTAINMYQRAYMYLMHFDLILANAPFRFGYKDKKLISTSTLFSPETSAFFNANTFKLGKEDVKMMDMSYLDRFKTSLEIDKKELKTIRKKYFHHRNYINNSFNA